MSIIFENVEAASIEVGTYWNMYIIEIPLRGNLNDKTMQIKCISKSLEICRVEAELI